MMELDDMELSIMRDAVKYIKRNKEVPCDPKALDAYWEKAAQELNGFVSFYKHHALAVNVGMAMYQYLEEASKK